MAAFFAIAISASTTHAPFAICQDAIVKLSEKDIRQDETLAVSEVGDVSADSSTRAPDPVVVPGTAVGGGQGRISSSDGDEMAVSGEVDREMIFPTTAMAGHVRPPMTPDVPSAQPFHGLLAKDAVSARAPSLPALSSPALFSRAVFRPHSCSCRLRGHALPP
eukprot:945189-Pleurochrysis_carterae.AAC.1